MRGWASVLVGIVALGLAGAVAAQERATDATARPVYYIGTREKVMALTFDVSWGEQMLPKVLNVLRQNDQTATFFLSGPWSKTHPDAVRAILEGGNEIASHGQAHVNLSGYGESGIADNVAAADEILRGYTPKPLRFFRPPNGDWNGRVVDAARGLGYETVIWSIDSRDWMNPGAASIISRVTREAFPGAIILLHASDTCKQTDLALPMILAQLRAQGYRLLTLGELWQMGPPMRDDPRGSGRKPNLEPAPASSDARSTPFSCPSPGAAA